MRNDLRALMMVGKQPKGANNMSIYDNIKTAKDLVFEVTAHVLSTKQEDSVKNTKMPRF